MSSFKLESISKSFAKGKEKFFALRNLSLSFPSKGMVFISGKSGSGKSTLLNILMGIERSDNGNLYYDHEKINKLSDLKASRFHLYKVSMIYQHYNLFEDNSAFENVVVPMQMKGISLSDAKKETENLFYKFGIEKLMKQKVSTLSGGEKQRVAILRALATSPKVLLCDEPTGALDSKNGEEIMKILKKLSKKILIIVVSHNQAQIEKYADRIIALKDGRIESDTNALYHNVDYEPVNNKYRYSSKWKRIISKIHLKTNLKKNIFAYFTLLFGFTVSLISIGFIYGSNTSLDNLLYTSLNSCSCKISDEEVFHINNAPLSFIKVVRPKLSKIDEHVVDFKDIKVTNNYEYLFSPYPQARYKKENISPQMVPLYSFNNNDVVDNLVISGAKPTSNNIEEVLINEEMVKLLSLDNSSVINEEINISFSRDISIPIDNTDNPLIKETFSYDISLIIRGVVKEFGFLNSPKIYYSFTALETFLGSKSIQKYSEYVGENVSYKGYYEFLEDDDPLTSYSYNIFVTNSRDIKLLFDKYQELKSEDIPLTIDSTYFDSYVSYRDLLSSFSMALTIFVVICLLGINFILGMLALSTFISKKKESAILTCLGARKRDITSLFVEENIMILLISYISSILLSIPIQFLLNRLFSNFYGIVGLFNIPFATAFFGIPFVFPIGLLLIFILVSSIFVSVPISIYKSSSISEELRDE